MTGVVCTIFRRRCLACSGRSPWRLALARHWPRLSSTWINTWPRADLCGLCICVAGASLWRIDRGRARVALTDARRARDGTSHHGARWTSHRTGSPLRDLLARSAALVERQGEFERELEVKTAQVRLSARIVCSLPFPHGGASRRHLARLSAGSALARWAWLRCRGRRARLVCGPCHQAPHEGGALMAGIALIAASASSAVLAGLLVVSGTGGHVQSAALGAELERCVASAREANPGHPRRTPGEGARTSCAQEVCLPARDAHTDRRPHAGALRGPLV